MMVTYAPDQSTLSKRDRLTSLASLQFNAVGFNATSVKEISANVGLSKTALYHYVKNKQELLYLCYAHSLDCIEEAIREGLESSGPDRIYRAVNHLFQQFEDASLGLSPHLALVFEGESLNSEQQDAINKRYFTTLYPLTIELLGGAITNSAIKNTKKEVLALFILNLFTSAQLLIKTPDLSTINKAKSDLICCLKSGLISTNKRRLKKCSFSNTMTERFISQIANNCNSMDAFYRAGAELFTDQGYHQTTIDQIAEHIQLTKGAFYHHFKNKTELLTHTLMQSITLHQYVFSESFYNSKCSGDALQSATRALQAIQTSEAGPLAMHYTKIYLPLDAQKELGIQESKLHDIIADLIESGHQDNSIAQVDSSFIIDLLKATIQMSTCLRYAPMPLTDHEKSADYTAILFYGLEA